MHAMSNHMAEGLPVLDVAPSREESTPRVAAVATGPRRLRPVMALGIDGAYMR